MKSKDTELALQRL